MTDKTTETNEADAKFAAENKKLKEQIAKLMDDQKAAQKEAEEAREAAEAAAEEKARAANDLAALEASLTKKYQKQLDDAKKALAERDASLQTLLIDNALASKMVEHNVSPALQPALMAMLKGQAKVEGSEAMIDGKSLGDFMSEWSKSDQAKAFITAPANTGTGAVGGSGSAPRFTKENFNMTEFMKFAATNPQEANAEADRLGMPHLKA